MSDPSKSPRGFYLLMGIAAIGVLLVFFFRESLSTLLSEPLLTPGAWLASHPHWNVGSLVISEPSSSLFIFSLAILYFRVAYLFWRGSDGQQSRLWWAVFMLFFGLGAVLAGVSYQAFSFELKCQGLDACLWTSWWEIGYMIFTVAGVGAAFIAVAYSVLSHKARVFWTAYAQVSTAIYVGVVLFGTITASRFLISFEMMIIFVLAGFFAIAAHALWQYRLDRNPLIKQILQVGILLISVIGVYFIGLLSGYAGWLWARGIWFNANDLLHVLLFAWVVFSYNALHKRLVDAPAEDRGV